jgi:hypothetical protein
MCGRGWTAAMRPPARETDPLLARVHAPAKWHAFAGVRLSASPEAQSSGAGIELHDGLEAEIALASAPPLQAGSMLFALFSRVKP